MHIHNLVKETLSLRKCPVTPGTKARVNIVALGDVGTTMLIGLKLLGSDVIESIGICDIRKENTARLEMEMNQIGYPFEGPALPSVEVVPEDELFAGDVLIFCASRGIPPVEPGSKTDVRMAQLDANRDIIRHYAGLARNARYQGLVCVVSDPVDNLCAAFLDESGLSHGRFRDTALESCTKERNTTPPRIAVSPPISRKDGPSVLTGKTW